MLYSLNRISNHQIDMIVIFTRSVIRLKVSIPIIIKYIIKINKLPLNLTPQLVFSGKVYVKFIKKIHFFLGPQ